METAVEKLTALAFLVTGQSHIPQPRIWIRFFVMLREKDEHGVATTKARAQWLGRDILENQ